MFKLEASKIFEVLENKFTEQDFLEVLNSENQNISFDDFAKLILTEISVEAFEKLAEKSKLTTLNRFGRTKGLYIPLYLSNECSNSCVYCGFRRENQIQRITLTEKEIEQELRLIFEKGFRNILLVSGELENFKNIDYLENAIKIAKKIGFHSIANELGSASEEFAKKLATAGSESFVLYQETYHEKTYEKVHLGGLKKDYFYRLASQERALKAGFKKVSFGFLAGLFDARFEALAMFEHLKFIRQNFWNAEIGISIPRMTSAKGADISRFKVPDELFARILMIFRIAFPDITISLSTRETPEFRDGLADICITNLSVESKTRPGGYFDAKETELEQFEVIDNRNLCEMIEFLKSKNYDIHVKDWEKILNEAGN